MGYSKNLLGVGPKLMIEIMKKIHASSFHRMECNSSFKKRGFKYYELGENYKIANEKIFEKRDLNLEFKEKYGSEMYPKSFFKN